MESAFLCPPRSLRGGLPLRSVNFHYSVSPKPIPDKATLPDFLFRHADRPLFRFFLLRFCCFSRVLQHAPG